MPVEYQCPEHALYQAQAILAAARAECSAVANLTRVPSPESMSFRLSALAWRLRAMSGALDALRGFGVEA